MKYLCLLFLTGLSLLAFSQTPLPKEAPLPLDQALREGILAIQVRGKGGYNGECLIVRGKNKTQDWQHVLIPPGWVFSSEDSSVQDLLNTKEKVLVLSPGGVGQIDLQTMCTQSSNMAPSRGERFRAGGLGSEHLQTLAQLIAEKEYHNSTAQTAVWAVANRMPVSMIYGEDEEMVKTLATTVSDLTGIPLSEFSLEPRAHHITSLASSLEVIIPRDLADANLAVYDEAGQVVQKYFEGRKLEPGFRQFKVGVFHTREEDLRLFLRLKEGEILIHEREIFAGDSIPPLHTYHNQLVFTYELPDSVKAEVGVYDEADSLNFILRRPELLPKGHHRSTYIVGTPLLAGVSYSLKLKTEDGKTLVEEKLDPNGPAPVRFEPQKEKGVFACELEQEVSQAQLTIYDAQGKVVRKLFENSKLYPGNKRYTYSFSHGQGTDAQFFIRLEDGLGKIISEQCINCK